MTRCRVLTLAIALLPVALAGTASAAGWRSLRVDASSEAAFEQSLVEFKDKLSPARRYVLGEALKDIWLHGSEVAAAEQREYGAADYYRQIDGLGYEEIVTFVDPTGETAKRYRAAYNPRLTGDRAVYRARTESIAPKIPWPEFPHSTPRAVITLHGPGPPPR